MVIRYGILGLLLCVFVAGSAMFVAHRGRTYRESLGSTRRARDEAVGPTSKKGYESPSAPKPTPNAGGAGPPSGGANGVGGPQPPKLGSNSPEPKLPTPPGGDTAAAIAQWKNHPFWARPALVKQWTLDHLTPEAEQQLGAQLKALIFELNPEDVGSGLRIVKEAADRLISTPPLLEIAQYQFFVLNSDEPNAFSHPGGYVYVSRKLLELIPDDEPQILEFVLAHEIAHVELHHAVTCLKDRRVQALSDGTLPKLYFLIIPYGYPDDLEFAADAWAYRRMKALGRSEHDCLKFLRILDRYAKSHGFEHGRRKPQALLAGKRGEPEAVSEFSPVDNHLSSHPAAYDRISRLKRLNVEQAEMRQTPLRQEKPR